MVDEAYSSGQFLCGLDHQGSLCISMFTGSLTEEVRALEEEIEAVKDKVDDPMICEKIRQFIYAPREIQDMLKADAGWLLSSYDRSVLIS